jgi:hypothetical protein
VVGYSVRPDLGKNSKKKIKFFFMAMILRGCKVHFGPDYLTSFKKSWFFGFQNTHAAVPVWGWTTSCNRVKSGRVT